jgi:hypothetical protein
VCAACNAEATARLVASESAAFRSSDARRGRNDEPVPAVVGDRPPARGRRCAMRHRAHRRQRHASGELDDLERRQVGRRAPSRRRALLDCAPAPRSTPSSTRCAVDVDAARVKTTDGSSRPVGQQARCVFGQRRRVERHLAVGHVHGRATASRPRDRADRRGARTTRRRRSRSAARRSFTVARPRGRSAWSRSTRPRRVERDERAGRCDPRARRRPADVVLATACSAAAQHLRRESRSGSSQLVRGSGRRPSSDLVPTFAR